jgi:hypothetical protein|tara:strand:- start:37 stop:237 length:201 start_codon:yes stop_codon:yes gene_type:complete
LVEVFHPCPLKEKESGEGTRWKTPIMNLAFVSKRKDTTIKENTSPSSEPKSGEHSSWKLEAIDIFS